MGILRSRLRVASDEREIGNLIARRRSEVVAAAVYLGAALALVLYFTFYWYWIPSAWTANLNEIALLIGAGLLLASSFGVFTGRRLGDLMALIGALGAWSSFRLIVFDRFTCGPWVLFNMPGGRPEVHFGFLMATLTILATSALVAATACSALRLTPKIWVIGKVPLRDRAWLGLAVALLFVVVWYVKTVSPYQIPIFDIHQGQPTISVLHVEKHGLHFSETYLSVYRDGKFYLARDDRSLFQYAFQRGVASGDITGDCDLLFNRLVHSPPEFSGSHVSSYVPPRAWNADRWYIYVGEGLGEGPLVWTQRSCPTTYFAYFMGVRSCHKNAWYKKPLETCAWGSATTLLTKAKS